VVEPRHADLPGGLSSVWVPSTLVRKNRPGSRIARLLCDSAAKFTTTSTPWVRSVSSTFGWSAMSACTKVIASRTSVRLVSVPA
jgi:hypothetical protein